MEKKRKNEKKITEEDSIKQLQKLQKKSKKIKKNYLLMRKNKKTMFDQKKKKNIEKKSKEKKTKVKVSFKRKLLNYEGKIFQSLAFRNIKMNFGTGLTQFIEFEKEMSFLEGRNQFYEEVSRLLNWLLLEQNNFRSFDGWRNLWSNEVHGNLLKQLSRKFFGKSFALSYVRNSKIKEVYKGEYIKKIIRFEEGAKMPAKFNAFKFKKDN